MPQMSTLSWFSLFILFASTFLLFNMISYFLYPVAPSSTLKSGNFVNSSSFNWKW